MWWKMTAATTLCPTPITPASPPLSPAHHQIVAGPTTKCRCYATSSGSTFVSICLDFSPRLKPGVSWRGSLMTCTYTTRTEAIGREIIEPIEAGAATAEEFDIDAIADHVLDDYEGGFACRVEHDEFWRIVIDNAR